LTTRVTAVEGAVATNTQQDAEWRATATEAFQAVADQADTNANLIGWALGDPSGDPPPAWTAAAYPAGSVVTHLGGVWLSRQGAAADQVPGSAARWEAVDVASLADRLNNTRNQVATLDTTVTAYAMATTGDTTGGQVENWMPVPYGVGRVVFHQGAWFLAVAEATGADTPVLAPTVWQQLDLKSLAAAIAAGGGGGGVPDWWKTQVEAFLTVPQQWDQPYPDWDAATDYARNAIVMRAGAPYLANGDPGVGVAPPAAPWMPMSVLRETLTRTLDGLSDVTAPPNTAAGKLLGTTATGVWAAVDPPAPTGVWKSWTGSQAAYDAIPTKHVDTLYVITS
jgi:hypothetical protein